MAEQAPILLLESEEGVIKDVTASLRLVGMSVLSKPTVSDLKSVARERPPVMVLARCRVAGNDRAGLQLVEDFANEDDLRHIPVIILCTPSEESILQDKLALFRDSLHLPVEFPYFTEEVQRIIRSVGGSPELPGRSRQPAGAEATESPPMTQPLRAAQSKAQPEPPSEREKLLAAYEIQLQVIENLKRDRRIASAGLDQVPEIVAQETRSVCDNFKFRQK